MVIKPKMDSRQSECDLSLEIISCELILCCNCREHICAFDVLNFVPILPDRQLLLELDTKMEIQKLPPNGRDFLVYLTNEKDRIFGNFGTYFRIWFHRLVH